MYLGVEILTLWLGEEDGVVSLISLAFFFLLKEVAAAKREWRKRKSQSQLDFNIQMLSKVNTGVSLRSPASFPWRIRWTFYMIPLSSSSINLH